VGNPVDLRMTGALRHILRFFPPGGTRQLYGRQDARRYRLNAVDQFSGDARDLCLYLEFI
jgi:hypothetical protein